MIEIKGIEKSFKRQKVLKGIDATIGNGKIYAILGPNGSGKTTLLKSILGLVIPDKGDVLIDGKSIKNDWHYRKDIGYMPQAPKFPENLNMKELITMVKDIRKDNRDEKPWIEYFKLQDFEKKMLKNFSGGMKQKVNAILTFMFDPGILIFDEPSVGLDPISHLKLKKQILEEKAKGKTILITTHIISEVEELADEIIFLLEGKVYFNGRKEDLKAEQNENRLDKAIAKMMENYEKYENAV